MSVRHSGFRLVRLSRSIVLIPPLVAGCFASADPAETTEEIGVNQSPIIGGNAVAAIDATADNVVRLAGAGGCTGTLLSARWVLTAAHCVGRSGPAGMTATTRSGVTAIGDWVIRHPDSSPPVPASANTHHGTDVALVHLDRNLGGPNFPALATSIPANGTTLSCYGYGNNTAFYVGTTPSGAGFGTLRTANNTVSASNTMRYNLSPNAAGQIQWQGDSGGPCFNASGQVTGVASGVGMTPPPPDGGTTLTVIGGDQIAVSAVRSWILSMTAGAAQLNADGCQTAPLPTAPAGAPASRKRTDLAGVWNWWQTTQVAAYTSAGTSFPSFAQWDNSNGGWSASQKSAAGNFSNDGLTDIASVWNDGGMATIAMRQSTGTSVILSTWATQRVPFQAGTRVLPGDFNGDGLADLAFVYQDNDRVTAGTANATTSVTVLLSTGSGFQAATRWATQQGGWSSDAKWVVGDFNGDGYDDLGTVWNNGGTAVITVRASNGTSFPSQAHWLSNAGGWMASTQVLAGKFKGTVNPSTGRPYWDIAAAWNNGGQAVVSVYPSNGSAFPGWAHWDLSGGGWMDYAKWTAGDVDGDGLTDLATVWPYYGTNTFAVRRSTGAAFQVFAGGSGGGWDANTQWCSGRLD